MQIDTTQTVIMASIVVLYVLITAGLSLWYGRAAKKLDVFMTSARTIPIWVIGILMMSEVIGTPSTVGTAQQAFISGMAVAWNIVTSLVAFVLFAFVLAPRLYRGGEYTISGAVAKRYGNTTRLVVSVIMIYALLVVNISIYIGGAASIAPVLKVPLPVAAIITAVVSAVYVAIGGLRSVAYVNVIHFVFKYLAVIIAMWVGLQLIGGLEPLTSKLPPFYFTWDGHVGFATILAWTIANMGAVFSTQQIVQAVSGAKSAKDARNAAIIAGVLCVPIGIFAALVGVAAKYLFPQQNSLLALPGFVMKMNPWLGGIVLTGLVAMVFANAAAVSLAMTSLLIKDFYMKYFKQDPKSLMTVTRVVSIGICFLPIPFVLLFPALLQTMFFAKALRTSISVVAVLAFYLPFFSSGRGATTGLIAASVGASVWFLLGNPDGIDNTYIAVVIPALVMGLDHLIARGRRPSIQTE